MKKRTAGTRPVAVVTGAGRGIGRGIALALAGRGFDVAGLDIVYEPGNKAEGLPEVAAAAAKLGTRFLAVRCDIADLAGHDAALDEVAASLGRIDVLVNNAGIAPEKRARVLETTAASYDRVMAVNTRGTFFFTQNAARRMVVQRKKLGGQERLGNAPGAEKEPLPAIIFITSISAAVSSVTRAEYCMSKAASSMAAALFADALAADGIAVYEVRPGIIATAMTAPVKKKYDRLIAGGLVPQGRWGTPEDVGRAVAALAGGDFGFSTGAVIEVSGGMNIRRL